MATLRIQSSRARLTRTEAIQNVYIYPNYRQTLVIQYSSFHTFSSNSEIPVLLDFIMRQQIFSLLALLVLQLLYTNTNGLQQIGELIICILRIIIYNMSCKWANDTE